jgi:hypothetical protein
VDGDRDLVSQLGKAADRFDELAEVADLMGDSDGAARFRRESAMARDRAMTILDRMSTPGAD